MSATAPCPVFVVGSFVMACCWFTPRLPGRGEHVHARGFLMEPGGKGLNVAVGIQRLGAPVHLLLGVGQDHAGDALTQLLRQEGIGSGHVHRFSGASGHGVGIIDEVGDNVIAVHPGANHRLDASHANAAAAAIAASRVVYAQFEAPDDVIAEAFRLGRRAGASNVLNPSPWREVSAEVLQEVDTLLLNEHEGAALLSLGPASLTSHAAWAEAMRPWRRDHPGVQLVVTLGDSGCLFWADDADQPQHRHALPVQAVDTTGCGDAFAAAWCRAIASDMGPEAALDLAVSAGAWMATQRGVLGALPSLDALRSGVALPP